MNVVRCFSSARLIAHLQMGWLLTMVGAAVTLIVVAPLPVIAAENGFTDIEEAGSHRPAVERLAEEGVLEGTECSPDEFCPTEPIKRWVMAVWLVRVLDDAEPAAVESSRFSDVEADQWWAPYVERLADLDITRGCASEPARFCPTEPVTRGQMASFLVRAFRLPAGLSYQFTDTGGDSHEADIDALASSGVTVGCATQPARYCPSAETTRTQMATFLTRALDHRQTPTAEGDFISIAAGGFHACGLRTDGTLSCWGNDFDAQADPIPGEFLAIAAGESHSCGLHTDQTVSCWGFAFFGQTAAPPENSPTSPLDTPSPAVSGPPVRSPAGDRAPTCRLIRRTECSLRLQAVALMRAVSEPTVPSPAGETTPTVRPSHHRESSPLSLREEGTTAVSASTRPLPAGA